MGTFITRQQAAEILGVSQRTLYRFVQRAYLRPAKQGRTNGVLQEDVVELKEIRDREGRKDQDEPLPFAFNSKSIGLLHARVSALENQMGTVHRLLGVRCDPLQLTEPELRALYQQATHEAEKGWSPHGEHQWADTFTRLRHEDLEQLHELADDEHPWRPFARLCATMYLVPYHCDLRDQLGAGRAHLRQLALVWAHLRGATSKRAEMLVNDQAGPNRRIVRRRERGTTVSA